MAAKGPVLVTGGAGFIGSNLAHRLARRGHRVRILDNLARPGVEENLEWLTGRHGDAIEPIIGDVRDEAIVGRAVRGVDAAFHLAAQVAVTSSLENPRDDLEINIGGTFNLLEALRLSNRSAPVVFASTNKVYGNLADFGLAAAGSRYEPADPEIAEHGISEAQPLDFHSPYGCSKGAADQYVLDYARSYSLRATVLRMSCIYGERQMGTEDQGWVAHFLIRALQDEPITIYGDGKQVRDICDVSDTVAAYLAALERIDGIAGQALNWGGGPANAVSLLAVLDEIAAITGRQPRIDFAPWRMGDQRWYVADTRVADELLGLPRRKPWRQGLRDLADWLADRRLPRDREELRIAARAS